MTHSIGDPAIARGVRDTGGRVTLAIYECRKPVIGAINGAAVGIGATMTLAMDVRIASDTARFGFVFGRLELRLKVLELVSASNRGSSTSPGVDLFCRHI